MPSSRARARTPRSGKKRLSVPAGRAAPPSFTHRTAIFSVTGVPCILSTAGSRFCIIHGAFTSDVTRDAPLQHRARAHPDKAAVEVLACACICPWVVVVPEDSRAEKEYRTCETLLLGALLTGPEFFETGGWSHVFPDTRELS